MQKVFSARLDEAVLNEMDRVTRRAGMSKRQFLEEAIKARAQVLSADDAGSVWEETRGAWKRRERPEASVRSARLAVRRAIERHQR